LTDAEVVTLCVAQALLGIPSDRRSLAVAPTPARALVSAPAATTGISQAPNPATARARFTAYACASASDSSPGPASDFNSRLGRPSRSVAAYTT
jgi:hypothetical protein